MSIAKSYVVGQDAFGASAVLSRRSHGDRRRGRLADLPPISVMNLSSAPPLASSPIDLTLTPDFRLGSVGVRPSTREVVAASGAIRLQPRVMQVLVALARAGGEVVSRQLLVEACWGDVFVGDDSLNRCIQILRRLSQEEAQGAFLIETIPRLGYRISVAEAPRAEASPPIAPNRGHWSILAGGVVATALLAITVRSRKHGFGAT